MRLSKLLAGVAAAAVLASCSAAGGDAGQLSAQPADVSVGVDDDAEVVDPDDPAAAVSVAAARGAGPVERPRVSAEQWVEQFCRSSAANNAVRQFAVFDRSNPVAPSLYTAIVDAAGAPGGVGIEGGDRAFDVLSSTGRLLDAAFSAGDVAGDASVFELAAHGDLVAEAGYQPGDAAVLGAVYASADIQRQVRDRSEVCVVAHSQLIGLVPLIAYLEQPRFRD